MAKFHNKFWNRDGSAKRCFVCISPQIETNVIDSFSHTVCEFEEVCKKCNTALSYWSFGSYDRGVFTETKEKLLEFRKKRLAGLKM